MSKGVLELVFNEHQEGLLLKYPPKFSLLKSIIILLKYFCDKIICKFMNFIFKKTLATFELEIAGKLAHIP